MTTLEILLIIIVWVSYGVFNSWQHDWFKFDYNFEPLAVIICIAFAPIAIIIRILRGIFQWKGEY